MRQGVQYALTGAAVLVAFALGYQLASGIRTVPSVELPTTRMSGALDPPPAAGSTPADTPPEHITHDRAAAQTLAQRAFTGFTKYVRNFQAGSNSRPNPNLYFLSSRYSGQPGLCEATAISLDDYPNGEIRSQHYYLVVGAFTAPPYVSEASKPGYAAYKSYQDNITANCAARYGSTDWFTMKDPYNNDYAAWNGARLIDGLVAAARRSGALPFKLICKPAQVDPHLCDDPRKSLATVDPKEIARLSGTNAIYDEANHLETIAEMKGDPFDQIVIHRVEPFLSSGDRITDVVISKRWRPIFN